MSIIIKEVNTPQLFKEFIYLPEKIHANHAPWVPPLYMDELVFFDAKKNPSFQKNRAQLFLAYQENTPVGRIMGIIPDDYNQKNHLKTARFSYLECYEDKRVFDALISAVESWAKNKECNEIIGPMGFSDKEPQGFLTKGFDEPTMLVTNCSFPYLQKFIEENGYQSFIELCQYDVPINQQTLTRYQKFADRVQRNNDLKVLEFTKTKEARPFVVPVFELINRIYTEIFGFTEVTEAEMKEFGNRFLPLLNPKLIKMITDAQGKVIAFVIAMPDLSEGFKKSKGRLLPFGWIPILWASKKSKKLMLLLGGVDNDMQNKGLDALLAIKLFKSALELGFTTMDSHLMMKENVKMRREIERIDDFRLYKEYTIYKKSLVE